MATTEFTGPVDYLVFTFPEGADLGAGLAAVLNRVNDGTVEILDLELVGRDESGAPAKLAFADLTHSTDIDLAVFDGVESEILDSEDLAQIADALEPGEFALALVYEDRSLAGAANAWFAAGGKELFTGGVAISDLEEALEERADA